MRHFALFAPIFVSASASLLASSSNAAAGTFQGKMTVDGVTMPVRYVCAYEEASGHNAKPRISLIVSPEAPETEITPCRASKVDLTARLDASAKPGLFLQITSADMRWSTTSIYRNKMSSSYSLGSDVTQFQAKPGAPARTLAGRLFTKSTAGLGNMPAFALDLTLDVPLDKLASEASILRGAVAQKHPAFAATREYLNALVKGEWEKARGMMSDRGRKLYDDEMKTLDTKQVYPLMQSMAKEFLAMPTFSVALRGDIVEVEVMRSANERAGFSWQQMNGVWRMMYEIRN